MGRRFRLASRALLPWLLAAAPALVSAASAAPRLDAQAILASRYGNDATWYADRIPLFESSDAKLDAVYYYRWAIYRAHQRDLGDKGYITTEFFDDVSWQREPYASLNDATGFHLYEGRWLRDRRFADDYIRFLYDEGGNDRHFSEAIADAVWARYLVDGDRDAALRHLPAMRHIYGLWGDRFDFAKGLYWIEPLLDATEYTVSSIDASGGKDGFRGGDAFRPSINSYMFANARAISQLSALAGDDAVARDYAARAGRLKQRVTEDLWSAPLGHFIDRYKVDNEHVKYWTPIRARELVGYLPWAFGMLDDRAEFTGAWTHLISAQGFAGAAGMRTVEPSYQYYMRQYRYDTPTGGRECQWNGPAWPFQTTQALMGLARLLQHGAPQSVIGRGDYLRLLRQYAQLHYQGDRLDLEEDYDPDSGKPIVGLARSHHYFHSGFDDLVITGLVGIEPSVDDTLTLDPLIPAGARGPDRIRYFALQDLPYHGHLVSVFYDEDGTRYREGRGMRLYVDGVLAGTRDTLGKLSAAIAPRANAPIVRPINRAANLVRSAYPRAEASSGAEPERLHDAIDGRVSFFPELPNGWDSASDAAEQWFAVDFGAPVRLTGAELSFFAGGEFAAPRDYRLEYLRDGKWLPVAARFTGKGDNGVASASFAPVTAGKLRVVMRKLSGKRIRLVELKAF